MLVFVAEGKLGNEDLLFLKLADRGSDWVTWGVTSRAYVRLRPQAHSTVRHSQLGIGLQATPIIVVRRFHGTETKISWNYCSAILK